MPKCKPFTNTSHNIARLIANRYRKNYGWVRLILIRKVTNIAAESIKEKNEPQRFEKAFDGIPRDVWHVFESPDECYQIISDVVERTG